MADYDYITAYGVVIPDTSTVKADVEAEYKEVYGSDLVVDSSTEVGRQIDAEVTSRMSVLRNNAKLANQINPNLAEQNFLDAIYALSNGERDGAERSTVTLTMAGVKTTIVPAGSLVQDEAGQNWQLATQTTIGSSGVTQASFFSVDYGPINAGVGEINQIVDGVLGWETVTNEEAPTLGKLEQSDVSTRAQRKLELAGNAINNTAAIITAVSAVEGVASLTFRENYTSNAIAIDDVELNPNSTYICVDGGSDEDIANAYYDSRSGGTDFNGSTSFTVVDPISSQPIVVKFDRPEIKPKQVRITVRSTTGVDQRDAIKGAIVDYANGLIDGEVGFIVGGNVSPFEIAAAVNEQVSNVFVRKCEVAEFSSTPEYTTDTIETAIFEKASISESNIIVVVV